MSVVTERSQPGVAFGALRELRRRNSLLFAVTLANFGLAVLFTVLMAVDGRTLLGRNVWTKPWKFATSIAIFTATMGWLLPSLELSERVEGLATYVIGGSMSIEIVLIATQAARGVASHFNDSTALNTSIFMVMGITITISSVVVGYVLWRVLRDPPSLSRPYRWGIGIGMFVFLVASFEGWFIIARESHAVGVANDSPGLPLLNWSVTGGDLRVSHFIGLHALQVLPLTGYVAARWDRLSTRGALAVVGLVSLFYALVTGGTFLLALLQTPLVSWVPIREFSPSLAAGVLLVLSVSGFYVSGAIWRRLE